MVKLVALLQRREGLSREEFERWWLEQHAPIAAQLPGLHGYRINLTTSARACDLAGVERDVAPPFDGTAELWFDSVEAMEAALTSPVGQKAGRDADAYTSVRIHLRVAENVIV